jgi:hypothetical protein
MTMKRTILALLLSLALGSGGAWAQGMSGGGSIHQQSAVFTTPGANSWTVPANVNAVMVVEACSGGGGGGQGTVATAGGGGGGGANCFFNIWLPVTPGSALTITVGAGGAAGTIGGSGGNGGLTTITGGRSGLRHWPEFRWHRFGQRGGVQHDIRGLWGISMTDQWSVVTDQWSVSKKGKAMIFSGRWPLTTEHWT